jgi:hypothetical protein
MRSHVTEQNCYKLALSFLSQELGAKMAKRDRGRSDNGANIIETYDPIKLSPVEGVGVQKEYIITTLIEAIQAKKFLESYAPSLSKVDFGKQFCLSQTPSFQYCRGIPYTAPFTPMSASPNALCIFATHFCLARSGQALFA